MTPSGTRSREAFDRHAGAYDHWFAAHPRVYAEEVALLRRMLPHFSHGVEIGAGTGRMALPLGIPLGLEPAPAMGQIAHRRGMEVLKGVAERLPFCGASFDLVLMATAISFFQDVPAAFAEVMRVLVPGGSLLLAFIDREGELGRRYAAERRTSRFFGDARFFSEAEVQAMLEGAGFLIAAIEGLECGYVACRAEKWG
ncbi:MAG: class I SAM-dependent methyltransferase [Methanomicrobiaceae archaeon]|nr:class I SAM-dependent methyltransferase [Methanomicrobiaceae archaeon]